MQKLWQPKNKVLVQIGETGSATGDTGSMIDWQISGIGNSNNEF